MKFQLIFHYYFFISLQYGEAAKEVLGSTKGTPVKCVFRPLDGLVRTRDHDIIRAESRGTVRARIEGKYFCWSLSCEPFIPSLRTILSGFLLLRSL